MLLSKYLINRLVTNGDGGNLIVEVTNNVTNNYFNNLLLKIIIANNYDSKRSRLHEKRINYNSYG